METISSLITAGRKSLKKGVAIMTLAAVAAGFGGMAFTTAEAASRKDDRPPVVENRKPPKEPERKPQPPRKSNKKPKKKNVAPRPQRVPDNKPVKHPPSNE